MTRAGRKIIRFSAWLVVVCTAHVAVTYILFGIVIGIWFLVGRSYESRPLQFGVIAAFLLPFLSDYPVAKWTMSTSFMRRITSLGV
jgi:hypothetical protein